MPSMCPHCGIGFNHWVDYSDHLNANHRHLIEKSNAHPRSTSGRSKVQIVAEAEGSWLRPYLVETDTAVAIVASNEVQHLDACRCMPCFNRRLDALLASQEEALKNQGV